MGDHLVPPCRQGTLTGTQAPLTCPMALHQQRRGVLYRYAEVHAARLADCDWMSLPQINSTRVRRARPQ